MNKTYNNIQLINLKNISKRAKSSYQELTKENKQLKLQFHGQKYMQDQKNIKRLFMKKRLDSKTEQEQQLPVFEEIEEHENNADQQ